LLVIMAAALANCTRHRSASDPAPAPADAAPETDWTLVVINHHWLDVSIYVTYENQRAHVGTVSATHTETYTLSSRMLAGGRTVRLEANPIGAQRNVSTDPLTVRGGGRVEWTLESGLERSTVAVW
jgi:hypothetical protein